jgi:hypothetical protein
MNQEIRNKLRNVVTHCRKLLEDSVSQELEGKYVIFAKKDQVTADPNAKMSHLTDEEQVARKDILDHFGHVKARGFKPKEALDQLVREIAFTHLNRLCAYKMMEAREVYVGGQKFREAVSRGINSNGVKFYLADHPDEERLFNTGHQDVAYRHFLDWLGGLLSEEIGVLFNPNDPANRLYPRQKTLDEVLDLLNGGGIKPEEAELREEWPKIWSQDETLGWVYQYFTPKELRDQARKESTAPRNSYELAFRNQFFTPRYVVEFLTDNTLGRIWFEMRKGDTKLKEQCPYLIRRPTEIFLKEGEQLPKDAAEGQDDLSQEERLKLPVHVPHRPKRDPRKLKILDPASGSGHFLLYCFDLLLTIYEEAYADTELGPALQRDYPKLEDLRRHIPRLILAHNVHGIDIDLRASQIAALALWLRCQRAYQEMGLKKDRLKITRSNFVCAEPMPGEEQILREFVGQLEPKLLGHVVEVVFDKMKLAGEAGSLLKIEEEIRGTVAEAKKQWVRETVRATDRKGQPLLFTQSAMDRLAGKPEQPALFDLSDISDNQFFEQAEANVIEALRIYAEKAQNGQRLQRRLFAEDAVRGFAFIDLCQKQFDVVLMNPPFGEASIPSKSYIDDTYPLSKIEVHTAFLQRMLELSHGNGSVGVICSRTFLTISSAQGLREKVLLQQSSISSLADLGNGVLDTAAVETCAITLSRSPVQQSVFFRLLDVDADDKCVLLNSCLTSLATSSQNQNVYSLRQSEFASLPGSPFAYWIKEWALDLFRTNQSLADSGYKVAIGCQTGDNERFLRLRWEVAPDQIGKDKAWIQYSKGGDYSPFFYDFQLLLNWQDNGREIKAAEVAKGRSIGRSITGIEFHFRHGLTYPLVTNKGLSVRPMPSGGICDNGGPGIYADNDGDLWYALGIVNSSIFEYLVRCLTSSRHWQAGYLSASPFPSRSSKEKQALGANSQAAFDLRRAIDARNEENSGFYAISTEALRSDFQQYHAAASAFAEARLELDRRASVEYGVTEEAWKQCLASQPERGPGIEIENIVNLDFGQFADKEMKRRISYFVGATFGRWDIRFVCSKDHLERTVPPAFRMLPACSPGMLQGANGLPLTKQPDGYPLSISRDGILVDDPENTDDIVHRVGAAIEVIWKDQADSIEQEACGILGVNGLRDYFRKPGNGGFWDDHISNYSKSRRKAPIYWLLQSSRKNYALWLYYHRVDKDLLFKALVNYVEPKLRLETNGLETLRSQKAAAGETDKEGKRLAKEIERQEDVLSELRDFEEKLRRAANLHLEPDHNDGVVLNIAPLYELVPWEEARKHWEELLAGKYEWSSIGKQLRQKGLVK